MVLYSRLDFTYVSELVVYMCTAYLQQTSWRKGTVLPDRDTVTFIRLKVTKISMFFIRLSMKLHDGEILYFLSKICIFKQHKYRNYLNFSTRAFNYYKLKYGECLP